MFIVYERGISYDKNIPYINLLNYIRNLKSIKQENSIIDHNSNIPEYPQLLKVLEEICNIYIIISVFVIGLESQTLHFYLVLLLVTFLITAVLLVNKYTHLVKINTAYLWIEFGYVLSTGILMSITTTILAATSEKTTGYILIFATGYTNAILFFADALDKYRSAINSRKKLYWNRPVQVLYEDE